MYSLYLIDTSALIYAGNSVVANDDSKKIEEILKFPVAGVRYALRRIIGHAVTGEVIAVFDARTDKNANFPEYKAQREHNRDIFFQKELLRFLLTKMGIKVAYQDNYEADDLIYSLSQSALNSGNFGDIRIVSDDKDVAGAIIDRRISRIGATSKTSTINVENYSIVLDRNNYIHYNSVLPYIMFRGKQSNNVSPMKDGKYYYSQFIEYAKNSGVPQSKWSNQTLLLKFVKQMATDGKVDGDFIREVVKRIPVVYPKIDGLKYEDIKPTTIDKSIVADYLSMLRETTALTYLDIMRVDPSTISLSKFDRFVRLYRSGAPYVDNDITTDPSFEFTNSFGDVNDSGMNVRTF